VGDGLLRLGRSGRVTYASPNAESAYRRLGLAADLIGAELAVVTAGLCASDEPLDESLMVVAAGRAPRAAEVDGNGSVVQLRAIPLIVGGTRTGALILVRDVTELRRRERELMTKDATIREIHHRVKNNLQTVAALLRLQSRRLDEPKARAALDEAVRRVGSIATVHETLSHAPEEIVDFDDVAERVAAMAGEVSAAEARVKPVLVGRFGLLPSAVATPLALVLAELLQNALQHGLAQSGSGRGPDAGLDGLLEVRVDRTQERLTVIVQDNGVGLPEEFDLASATSLGLQIVRTLVVSELGGRLEVKPRAGGGTKAVVDLPMDAGAPLSARAAPIRP
jgi:two-component sensor histidine kinase